MVGHTAKGRNTKGEKADTVPGFVAKRDKKRKNPENFLLPELVKYGNISIVERNLRGRAAGR